MEWLYDAGDGDRNRALRTAGAVLLGAQGFALGLVMEYVWYSAGSLPWVPLVVAVPTGVAGAIFGARLGAAEVLAAGARIHLIPTAFVLLVTLHVALSALQFVLSPLPMRPMEVLLAVAYGCASVLLCMALGGRNAMWTWVHGWVAAVVGLAWLVYLALRPGRFVALDTPRPVWMVVLAAVLYGQVMPLAMLVVAPRAMARMGRLMLGAKVMEGAGQEVSSAR